MKLIFKVSKDINEIIFLHIFINKNMRLGSNNNGDKIDRYLK